ncbi:MAG: hypothetical protein K9M82_10565 [Deltaproteobacteria bacterium]|nr:hypothetical protein [Deltaproteobacteria bacterium]
MKNPAHTLRRICLGIALMLILAWTPSVSSEDKQLFSADCEQGHLKVEKQWGIRPLTLRLTGAGHFLDFRYLVTDSEKAGPILSRNNKAFLENQSTGKVFPVPVTKLGSMRSTTRKPEENRQYFMLFANTDSRIKKGDVVAVIVGDVKVEGLVVQ